MIANVFECGSYSGFYTLEGVKYQQHVFMELNQMCLLQHMHIMFLLPILIKNKQSYLATLHGNTKLKSKRRLGISYHRGWILGVEKV